MPPRPDRRPLLRRAVRERRLSGVCHHQDRQARHGRGILPRAVHEGLHGPVSPGPPRLPAGGHGRLRAEADAPGRRGHPEGHPEARRAEVAANRSGRAGARPGRRGRGRALDRPGVRRGGAARGRHREGTERPGDAHRPRARLELRHSAPGALEREVHRERRLQPAVVQAEAAPRRESARDVGPPGRRVRRHRRRRPVPPRPGHPAGTGVPVHRRGVAGPPSRPAPTARTGFRDPDRRGRRHARLGRLPAPVRRPSAGLPTDRLHPGHRLLVHRGEPAPGPRGRRPLVGRTP